MSDPCIDAKAVAIIDGNPLRQASVARFLEEWATSHRLQVVCVSSTALAQAFCSRPGLVILSLGQQPLNSIETQSTLQLLHEFASDAPIVILSDSANGADVICAYRSGCSGFLFTTMEPLIALNALTFIVRGGTYFPPSALNFLENSHDEPPPPTQETNRHPVEPTGAHSAEPFNSTDEGTLGVRLTSRQYEILGHLHRGSPNKIIARALGLSEGTVKVHVRQIMRRLGAANRTEAAVLCMRIFVREGLASSGQSAPDRAPAARRTAVDE